MAQKIFAFGGYDDTLEPIESAEVYDIVKNSWRQLPNMPDGGRLIT